jgi:hypothetical protein
MKTVPSTAYGGQLEVRSADFLAALRALFSVHRHGRLVRLSFAGGELRLACVGSSPRIPASGEWSGEAAFPAKFLKGVLRLREQVPEVLVVGGTETHVHFSYYSIPCKWTPAPK